MDYRNNDIRLIKYFFASLCSLKIDKIKTTLFLFGLVCTSFTFAQKPDLFPKIKAFKPGEYLQYEVYYNWGLIWANTATVNFTVTTDNVNNKQVLHLTGQGTSRPNWDWFFKVRDKYESYTDSNSLKPYRYIRNTSEGDNWTYNDVWFDFQQSITTGIMRNKKQPIDKHDTVKINYLTLDPLSMIYYARTINYDQFKEGEEFPVSIFLDNKVYYRKIKYIGREIITTDYGKFKCIKFRPSMIPGSIFKEGDEMTVWLTDDNNRLPVKIETPIVVGSIKAYLKIAKGLRYSEDGRLQLNKK
jgi:hypothetical protein